MELKRAFIPDPTGNILYAYTQSHTPQQFGKENEDEEEDEEEEEDDEEGR